MTPRWDVGSLPFVWRPLPTPSNAPFGLPDVLPFVLTTDPDTGALRQEPNPAVLSTLEVAYALGSTLPGIMEAGGIGERYAGAFLTFIREALDRERFDGLRVLEVGCGRGFLLSLLRDRGADVLGVEPGAQGSEGAREYDIPVVRGFFPDVPVEGMFDLSVSYGVLEHVPDPVGFLRAIRDRLRAGGRIVVAVPDCGPYIGTGDPSILFHEHLTYFDVGSLQRTLEQAGFHPTGAAYHRFGDSLFVVAEKAPPRASPKFRPSSSWTETYGDRVSSVVDHARAYLRSYGESLGVYVPSRFANLYVLTGAEPKGLRFFDDNPKLVGTFLPGIPAPIEGGTDAALRGVRRVLIASRAFHDSIAQRLWEAGVVGDGMAYLCHQ